MIRRTTPLLVNLIDRPPPQQSFLPIRVVVSRSRPVFLQYSRPHHSHLNSYFTCALQSRGLSTATQLRPEPEPTVAESFLHEGDRVSSSLSTPQEPPRLLLSSHNFYPEPPAPTTAAESSEVFTQSKHPSVGTDNIESAMDQNSNYQGFNPGLNLAAPSFDINSAGGQPYQQLPAQPDPAPGVANNQSPSHKKNKKGEYLTPRQRRKVGRADFLRQQQQPPGPSPLSNGPISSATMWRNSSSSLTSTLTSPPGLPPNSNNAGTEAPSRPQPAPYPTFPPSRASGGIPNPTDSYLQRASLPPTPSLQPRNLLLVIDLNGTLLHRPSSRRSAHFISRPHSERFLRYCIDTFSVVIWSSARPENVSKMCDTLLTQEQKEKVLAIWGRDKFGLSPEDYNRKVQVYKRLTAVWKDEGINPHGFWHQGNTILIDDSVEKARSEPHNAVTLPEFLGDVKPEEEGGKEWGVLPAVHEYLNKLAMTEDVSRYIRADPFRIEMAERKEF
ncbi:HAD-like domain-containing protein [Triangularia verruculosa]|uniref:Mitochondrial import inner membrane translocase subunit TIM50 n=1 Tax=Triangularia verruculosa TaxID=2587418 RepID=A0AAN7AV97_9PEZI|nr:HAD-like domain-containing protein [Triangularia verruculosa]